MSTRLLLNPLLRPEIIEWNVSSEYEFATGRLTRFRAPATTPPSRFMTVMVPGLPFHLPLLEPSRTHSEFITVGDVLNWIHDSLNNASLSDMEYDTLFGRQREMARYSCCMREEVAVDLQSDEFLRDSIRRIDLMAGRLHFGGLQHQYDANGANVWVVILKKTRCTASVPYLHHLMEPGRITWDFKDMPPAPNHTEPFEVVGNQMAIMDISGHPFISIPVPDTSTYSRPVSFSTVLDAIYVAMNIRLRNTEWPLWDSNVAGVLRDVFANATAAQRDNILVYLDMVPVDRQRFLGLWHDIHPTGHLYTLLTQPSVRPVPEIHHNLRQGHLEWELSSDPTRKTKGTWVDEPATSPGRSTMDMSIEFMPGVSWTLSVSKPSDTEFVTAHHLLSSLYGLLVQDELKISFNKLPLHLQHRIKQRAALRRGKPKVPASPAVVKPPKERSQAEKTKVDKQIFRDKKATGGRNKHLYKILSKEEVQSRKRKKQKAPPTAFKRIDVLESTTCVGIEHVINALGEDEWRVCLRS